VVLKLIAARADRRRQARDLLDVQFALEAYPELSKTTLAIPAIRSRLRELYGIRGENLRDLLALFRQASRADLDS
jgi:hypothetical protein